MMKARHQMISASLDGEMTLANPKGIPSFSPGLLSLRGYPGLNKNNFHNPEGVVSPIVRQPASTPLGLPTFPSHTQGSSFLATLGWMTQSLWDWAETLTNNPSRLPLTPRAFPSLPGGEGWGEGERSHKHFPPFFIHHSSFCISL
jgi:hypothetical protein